MLLKQILKKNEGQVLLMVMITSSIALLIVTGVFLRVLKLTRQEHDIESHEAAFSIAETYSRKVIDEIEKGTIINQSILDGWSEKDDSLVSAIVNSVNQIHNLTLKSGEAFEIVNPTKSSQTKLTIKPFTGDSDTRLLFTVVYYDGAKYYSEKAIYLSNYYSEGNLTSNLSCKSSWSGERICTYSHNSNEISFSVKAIGGDIDFSTIKAEDTILYEYIFTTKEDDTLSEATLTVSASNSMSPIFDYALYNGYGSIQK